MSKAFVEYQILPNYRTAYSSWMAGVRAAFPELEWLEGTDQPGLFVEIWNDLSYEQFTQLKQARQLPEQESFTPDQLKTVSPDNPFAVIDWTPLAQWVKGGGEKIHIWHFQKAK